MSRYPIAVVLPQVFHALALGEIRPDEAVDVFVDAAFPGMVRRREGKAGVVRAFDGGVAKEAIAVVKLARYAQRWTSNSWGGSTPQLMDKAVGQQHAGCHR